MEIEQKTVTNIKEEKGKRERKKKVKGDRSSWTGTTTKNGEKNREREKDRETGKNRETGRSKEREKVKENK